MTPPPPRIDGAATPGRAARWDQDKWQLYHVAEDFSESDDMAEKYPEKLMELQKLFDEQARKYHVYPLYDDYDAADCQAARTALRRPDDLHVPSLAEARENPDRPRYTGRIKASRPRVDLIERGMTRRGHLSGLRCP